MIVGGLTTHNSKEGDLNRAVASLRSVCDKVVAFDDGSTDDTVDRLSKLVDVIFTSEVNCPEALQLRRQMLYSEAERLGASWFVFHDDDEAFSQSISRELRNALSSVGDDITSVAAAKVNFFGSQKKMKLFNGAGCVYEFIACRANVGLNYYGSLLSLINRATKNDAWHAPRAPDGFLTDVGRLHLKYPKFALLHYGLDSMDKVQERRKWSASTGCVNRLDDDPVEGELVNVPEPAPWE